MVKISRILSVSAIILGLYVIVAASQFPEGADGVPGPGFFPVILGIMIILLSVLQLFNTRKDKDDDTKFMNEGTRRVLISCAIIIGYLVGMEVLGFIISTPIFLFSIMWYFSVRKDIDSDFHTIGVNGNPLFRVFEISIGKPAHRLILLRSQHVCRCTT